MTNLLARVQTALAERYAIERELGQGGMAVVFLARDLKHHRAVAIKVLRPELALAVGTPGYMSPEQAAGERELDGRSDVYSLACVLYEMLAGSPPFLGSSARAILARQSLDPVPRLRTVRETVPEEFERAVVKALAKAPADRFATATQFAEALVAGSPAPRTSRRALLTRVGLPLVAALTAIGAG